MSFYFIDYMKVVVPSNRELNQKTEDEKNIKICILILKHKIYGYLNILNFYRCDILLNFFYNLIIVFCCYLYNFLFLGLLFVYSVISMRYDTT